MPHYKLEPDKSCAVEWGGVSFRPMLSTQRMLCGQHFKIGWLAIQKTICNVVTTHALGHVSILMEGPSVLI